MAENKGLQPDPVDASYKPAADTNESGLTVAREHDPTNPFAPRFLIKKPTRLMTDAERRAAGLDPNGGFDGPTGAD